MRREIAEQSRPPADEQASAYDGLKITNSDGRWLPTIRSQESLDRALRGDAELLGQRIRAGAVSHDEREFLDDVINGRIKPGKALYNQRAARARRRRVARYIANLEQANPDMKREAGVAAAMERFGIARSEVYNSLKQDKSNEPD